MDRVFVPDAVCLREQRDALLEVYAWAGWDEVGEQAYVIV